MPIFKKISRSIKFRMLGTGLKLLRDSAQMEESYIEECEEQMKAGNSAEILSYNKDSPIRGEQTIIAELDKSGLTTKDLCRDDIDEMKIRGRDIFTILPLKYRDYQIHKGINRSFRDLEKNRSIEPKNSLIETNQELWDRQIEYAHEKWGIQGVGFTKIPIELIFDGKFIHYPYTLVFIEEMRKKKIDKAPLAPAGYEAVRVYAHLGRAVNDIASWLRENGVRCQSNHPTGGLVLTPPLAAKAGLGWQGKMGMLVTPEFGVRQRIASIFIKQPIFKFTDSNEHQWIENYCATCGLCAKRCPGEAIFD